MKKPSEFNILKAVCEEAEANGRVKEIHMTQLSAAFGSRFEKAWESLKEERVKKYVFEPSGKIVWIVVGKKREYLVMPVADFCSCNDFYFRVMDREVHLCYHLIAQKLAEALKGYDLVEERDELFHSLMEEWKKVTP